MQQSANALKKYEETNLPVADDNSDERLEKEPQFGDRSYKKSSVHKSKLENVAGEIRNDNPLPKVIKRVTEDRIVRVSKAALEENISQEQLLAIELHTPAEKVQTALLPCIYKDIVKNSITYFLIVALTCLCVYKVQLVQNTRQLNIQYNELIQKKETLHREWLSLLSQRESLTEYSVVRQKAMDRLAMAQPKTEDEVVIDLR